MVLLIIKLIFFSIVIIFSLLMYWNANQHAQHRVQDEKFSVQPLMQQDLGLMMRARKRTCRWKVRVNRLKNRGIAEVGSNYYRTNSQSIDPEITVSIQK
ncbi:hypothetical protein BCT62_21835 [Vibrio splendidus]|nr:hypothetical protein BCT62_21835 [Vibrio splendidus]PMN26256.1 hypothetical protein BCT36_10415 [Vibrio splendidus]